MDGSTTPARAARGRLGRWLHPGDEVGATTANDVAVLVAPRRHFPTATMAAVGVSALVLLGGCTDGSSAVGRPEAEAPEGYEVVVHPRARVALPDDWTRLEEPPLAEQDPDAVELVAPDAPEGVQLGASLWRYHRDVSEDHIWGPVNDLVLQWSATPDYDQFRREPLNVAGTDDAYLIQARVTGAAMEGAPEVLLTYASARAADGESVMILQLIGPEDIVTPEDVETALETFTITSS